MPILINGIGTRYVGRSHPESHFAICDFCGSNVQLTHSDSRLWFCLLFVPVVPVQRVRILDECPACKRFRVSRLRDYERNRQLTLSSVFVEWRRHPTVQNGIQTHQALLGFRLIAEADRFSRELHQKFHNEARLHAYQGSILLNLGRLQDAEQPLIEALRLRPGLAEARMELARLELARGNLDSASEHLQFLRKPGSSHLHNLGILEQLALRLHQQGRPADAFPIFKHLLEELPSLGQVAAFRKVFSAVEAALQQPTILPPKQFLLTEFIHSPRARLIAAGIFLLLLTLGLWMRGAWIARHRVVHVSNGTGSHLTLQPYGRDERIFDRGLTPLPLPEGDWKIAVRGVVTNVLDLPMRTSLWERWTRHPVWILNPGSGSIVREHRFRIRGTGNNRTIHQTFDFHPNEQVISLPHVTHPFQPYSSADFNHERFIKSGHQILTLESPGIDDLHFIIQQRPDQAMTLVQSIIRANPGNGNLFLLHEHLILTTEGAASGREFLRRGLANRPVNIHWHKAWQGLKWIDPARLPELTAHYNAMLQEDPDNPSILYLRGRVAAPAERAAWFQRAIHKYPLLEPAHFSMAESAICAGDGQKAMYHLDQIAKFRPDIEGLRVFQLLASSLEDPPRALAMVEGAIPRLQVGQHDQNWAHMAIRVLGTQDRIETARKAVESWSTQLPPQAANYLQALLADVHYQAGNFQETLRLCPPNLISKHRLRLSAMLSLGDLQCTNSMPQLFETTAPNRLSDMLAVSIACDLKEQSEWSHKWFVRVLDEMTRTDAGLAALSQRLRSGGGITSKDVFDASTSPDLSALFCTAMARHSHASAKQWDAEALRFVRMPFEHNRLIRQFHDRLEGGRPR